jgi:hypothetical protein
MMAITTNSSINVNPHRNRFMLNPWERSGQSALKAMVAALSSQSKEDRMKAEL